MPLSRHTRQPSCEPTPRFPPSRRASETLAHAVTADAQGPLAQAELLVNWFRSGQFHYTLDPPASPPGTDPLVSFLTQTRSGSCEQFAGAFVVLARSLGLPSRVVVGFTAGRYSGPGQVTVRGADAHAWPQVYLGSRAGWVSFEPTPQQPRGEVAPEGVVGPSGVNTTTPTTGAGSRTTTPPPTAPLTVPTTVPAPSGSNTFSPMPTPGSGLGSVWWTVIGAAVVLVVVLVLLLIRRRRRWSPAGRTPEQLALLSQAEVDRALRRAGVERPLWQPMERVFEDLGPPGAGRVDMEPSATAAAKERSASLIQDGVTVAHAADAALFDPLATSDERSRTAYEAALRVRKGLPGLRLTLDTRNGTKWRVTVPCALTGRLGTRPHRCAENPPHTGQLRGAARLLIQIRSANSARVLCPGDAAQVDASARSNGNPVARPLHQSAGAGYAHHSCPTSKVAWRDDEHRRNHLGHHRGGGDGFRRRAHHGPPEATVGH